MHVTKQAGGCHIEGDRHTEGGAPRGRESPHRGVCATQRGVCHTEGGVPTQRGVANQRGVRHTEGCVPQRSLP